jgi:hypothetical protein
MQAQRKADVACLHRLCYSVELHLRVLHLSMKTTAWKEPPEVTRRLLRPLNVHVLMIATVMPFCPTLVWNVTAHRCLVSLRFGIVYGGLVPAVFRHRSGLGALQPCVRASVLV